MHEFLINDHPEGDLPSVNINEIRINQTGKDDNEYFELIGEAGESLAGLSYVVIGDNNSDTSGVIEEVIDLSAQSFDENGFFVAAQNSSELGSEDPTTSLNFEDTKSVTHLLVSNFIGRKGNDLDTNNDGTLDVMPWQSIVDSVALLGSNTSDLVYSDTSVGPDNDGFVPAHVFRSPNTTGDFQIGTFKLAGDTPNEANPGGDGDDEVSIPEAPVFVVSTDANGDGFISDSELNGAQTVTATVTLASRAAVGDQIVVASGGQTLVDRSVTAEDLADGVTIENIAVPPSGTSVTFTSTLTNSAGTSPAGIQTFTIGNPPEGSAFTPSDDGSTVDLTDLGNATAVRFNLDNILVDNASEIRVFSASAGGAEIQLDTFSVLQAGQIDSSFTPSFSLDATEGDTLRFELVDSDDSITDGTTSIDSDGNGLLTFGTTTLSLATDDGTSAPNLVVNSDDGDGAAALDFRDRGGDSTVEFTVFREADFDSTVGLYIVDDLTGQVSFNGQTFQFGDAGYAEAALNQAVQGLSLSTSDGGATTTTATVDDALFGMYITVQDPNFDTAQTYFSFLSANDDSNDHVKLLGSNAIGFEDLPGLGDADFNDLVVSFEISAAQTLG